MQTQALISMRKRLQDGLSRLMRQRGGKVNVQESRSTKHAPGNVEVSTSCRWCHISPLLIGTSTTTRSMFVSGTSGYRLTRRTRPRTSTGSTLTCESTWRKIRIRQNGGITFTYCTYTEKPQDGARGL